MDPQASQYRTSRSSRADVEPTRATHGGKQLGVAELRQLPASRYVAEREIARGGMGRVVLARDTWIGDRRVVIKQMLKNSPTSVETARFLREAIITGLLEHPNIAPVHDVGVDQEGRPCYVMRYIDGMPLSEILSDLRAAKKEVTARYTRYRLLEIFLDICRAIAYAHSQRVVHRDLKPSNVIVGPFGDVQVADWGICGYRGSLGSLARLERGWISSQREQEKSDNARLTLTGEIFGTPAYMAPEQAEGRIAEMNEQTDIYQLGAILYEILSFHAPAEGKTIEEVQARVKAGIRIPPSQRVLLERVRRETEPGAVIAEEVPEDLDRICMKALAYKKKDRGTSVQELADEIRVHLEGVKERQARTEKAGQIVAAAQAIQAQYTEVASALGSACEKLQKAQQELSPRAPIDLREEMLLPMEQACLELEEAKGELLEQVVEKYLTALEVDPVSKGAREGLADLAWEHFVQAEEAGDKREIWRWRKLVEKYHDGKYGAHLSVQQPYEISLEPASAWPRPKSPAFIPGLIIERFDLSRPRGKEEVLPKGVRIEDTPGSYGGLLPIGSYLFSVRLDGYAAVSYHAQIRRTPIRIQIHLRRAEEIPPGFVWIPAGPFAAGHPDNRQEVLVDYDYAIAAFPVTLEEYALFLDELRDGYRTPPEMPEYFTLPRKFQGKDSALGKSEYEKRLPSEGGIPYLIVGSTGKHQPNPQWPQLKPRVPVIGITWFDTMAYCLWRSAKDRLEYRLPTACEWEKAARGADGRRFPWGDPFQARFCNMVDSFDEPKLCEVGTFRQDESPYGVHDCAGSVREWCLDEGANGEGIRLRGGAWRLPEYRSVLWDEGVMPPYLSQNYVGARLVVRLK